MHTTSRIASAVIPFYGDPTDTLALIEQLKQQSLASNLEIIVSDDCSPTPFPQTEGVTVIRRETNGGFGANVNSGVEAATGKWLFILNSDLSVPRDFIEKAVAQAEELGNALFAPQILGHNGESQYVARAFPTTFHVVWEWLTPLARIRSTKFWHKMVGHRVDAVTGATLDVDWVMGACMVMPTEFYRMVGGMDERFFMNSEEVDLQLRLKQRGVRRVFAGNLVVEHVGGASSGDIMKRRQWVLNSRFIYADKWSTMQNLGPALKAASLANYAFNKARALRNKAVKPEAVLRQELQLIRTAEQAPTEISQ